MIAAVLLLAAAASGSPPATVIHQSTTGWCSPVIANVTGNVTVNCIGVDPRALNRLNTQLSKKDQQLTAKIAEANEWADRYHELETQLKEAGATSELSKQAQEYVHQGDFEKAKDILDRLLKEDVKQQDRIAMDYYQRGLISELEFKPLEALPDFERAYRLDPDHLKFAVKYAGLLLSENEHAKAEPVLNEALLRAREQMAKDPATSRDSLAWLLYNRATLMRETSRFTEAEGAYTEALAQFRLLAKDKPAVYQLLVSIALLDQGAMYDTLNRFDAAETALKEALAIQRSLPQSDRTQIFISFVLSNLATLDMKTGRKSEGLEYSEQAVAILRELAKAKPAAYEPDLGNALNNLAVYLQSAGRLPDAERAAGEAIDILSRAAATNPGAHRASAARALTTLANIYCSEKRRDEADATFEKALTILRELIRDSPQSYEGQLATILEQISLNDREINKQAEAMKAGEEALTIYRRLATASFDAYGANVVRSAGALGRLYEQHGNDAAAEPLFREAVDNSRRLSAGRQGLWHDASDDALASNLLELAVLYYSHKDAARARQAAEEALTVFNRLRAANAAFNRESMARCMMIYAALIERENFPRACAMAGEAAALATDAATQQGAKAAYANCSQNPAFRRKR